MQASASELPSEENFYIPISVTEEKYPLIIRELSVDVTEVEEVDSLAGEIVGRFIPIWDVSGYEKKVLIAQITGVYLKSYTAEELEIPEERVEYELVFKGIGIVDPINLPRTMVPLNAIQRLKMDDWSITYDTLDELKAKWESEAKKTIGELVIGGENVTTPRLTRMRVFLE